MRLFLFTIFALLFQIGISQVNVTIHPNDLLSPESSLYRPGVFYVPKTEEAQVDFLTNGTYQNCIRTHIIESALNNAENLEEALDLLDTVEPILLDLSEKTERVLFIFEKMPAWLSSSDDGSPATTPGWFVLNTLPPASWDAWSEMVSAITDKIWNEFEITNAAFEIWNEPDLGSWTGGSMPFMELVEKTYDAIKTIDETIPVGGPAVNNWNNNISFLALPGYTTYEAADSSLISDLLEWSATSGKPLDIVSWHLFGVNVREHKAAEAYIREKCAILGVPVPELIISEWNAPSVLRDGPLAKSFMVRSALEISTTGVSQQVVAAWQDFEEEPEEFHNDYGLLTYGAIHKPAYYSLLMVNELKGSTCALDVNPYETMKATAYEDTIYVLISNYCPTPFSAALLDVFYTGQITSLELEEAGYVDLETGDLSVLLSIFEGEMEIPDGDPVNDAINDAIPVYSYFLDKELVPQTYTINFDDYSSNYAGRQVHLGKEKNNMQWKYDSLLSEGYTQTTARSFLVENQKMTNELITVNDGIYTITLEPNDVILLKIRIDGVGNIQEEKSAFLGAYPNPTENTVYISGLDEKEDYYLVNALGRILRKLTLSDDSPFVDLSAEPVGVYCLVSISDPKKQVKLVKN